jgi:Fic family protein
LPPLPPAQELETREVLKKCITARSALAALQQAASLIPNQTVLINSIPLREAKDSSEIENIVTTNDKLFRYASIDEEKADPSTKETLRYRSALLQGYLSLKDHPITTRTAVTICRAIKNVDLDIRKTPGTTLVNKATGETIYTPPVGENLLRDKLANWEMFIHNNKEIDPLIRMAVAHYQFEAIHPFPDGNGRTGRILNILMIIEEKLLDLPIIYLSGYILKNRDKYYEMLKDVTFKGKWQEWILYMLDAVEETAKWTTRKILEIKILIDETCKFVSEKSPKIYKRELIEAIFDRPYTRTTDLVNIGIGHRNTVSKYLKGLAELGILISFKEGREIIYINRKFLELLAKD